MMDSREALARSQIFDDRGERERASRIRSWRLFAVRAGEQAWLYEVRWQE